MALSSKIARPMMAAMFVTGGLDSLRHPGPKVPVAENVASRVARPLGLPEDTETLVRINGGVQVGAGILLAIGRFPRLAAAALATTLVPTTLAAHRFWDESEAAARRGQRIHFLKNLAIGGGLVVAATDRQGRPSVAWRARRAARRAGKATGRASERAGKALPGKG